MVEKITELYFRFWGNFGVGTDTALIIFFFVITYFVLKHAIKNGIVSAFKKIKNTQDNTQLIDKLTLNKAKTDGLKDQ